MEWPKLKNIILYILILTNLFLLAVVARRDLQDGYLQNQARENAIVFLEDRGIQGEEGAIPREMTVSPRTASRDLEREAQLAAALLGKEELATTQLGGEVYRYSNENGYLQFHSDGAFQGMFVPGFLPVGLDREGACLAVLKRLGFEGEFTGLEREALVFRQTWEGVPLFNHTVSVVVTQEYITALSGGRRLVSTPQGDSSREAITVPTALVRFSEGLTTLNDVCSSIDAVTQGYVSAVSLSGPMSLTPVWQIDTDTGSYQLDLVTGELIRVE